jgi:hypothetical protein
VCVLACVCMFFCLNNFTDKKEREINPFLMVYLERCLPVPWLRPQFFLFLPSSLLRHGLIHRPAAEILCEYNIIPSYVHFTYIIFNIKSTRKFLYFIFYFINNTTDTQRTGKKKFFACSSLYPCLVL